MAALVAASPVAGGPADTRTRPEHPPAIADDSPGFALRLAGEFNPYPVMSAFVLPGENLVFEVVPGESDSDFLAESEGGVLQRLGPTRWSWRAPLAPGLRRITVNHCSSGRSIGVNAFVMVPYRGEEEVGGYRIGSYEAEPLDDDPAYVRPAGLVEVTPENEDTWVSPSFQLKNFLCKQESEYPKYLVLKTRLLVQLENLQAEIAAVEGPQAHLRIMSAYRTPEYNRRIGNRTSYSRHLYGDAADVFIDRDGDDEMDDIDGDGRVSTDDAGRLYVLVNSLLDEPWYQPYIGGLGLYGEKRDRGPFIHVDTRGTHARWGDKRGKRWLADHLPNWDRPGSGRAVLAE